MPRKNDEKWLEQFEVYKKYVGENLRFPPSLAVYEGFKIGQWFRNQVTAYQMGSLPDYRRALMDGFQPAWCGSEEAKKEAMRQMALGFDWSSRVPEGRMPIDRVFQDGERLEACLKAKIYDVETYFHMSNHLPKFPSAREKALFSQENCQEAFRVLFPTFGAGHVRLFQDVFGFKGPDNFEKACYFFRDHIRSFSDNVEMCLGTVTEREEDVIRARYGIGMGAPLSFGEISSYYQVTGSRIQQIAEKALRKLRHPSRTVKMLMDPEDNSGVREQLVPDSRELHTWEYDDRGNCTFHSWSNAYWGDGSVSSWEKMAYDQNDNMTFFENSFGEWEKREYNDAGNLVFSENSKGEWYRAEYNARGGLVFAEDHTGAWSRCTYDENGNLVLSEKSDGWWEKREYNEKNWLTLLTDSTGNVIHYNGDPNLLAMTIDELDLTVRTFTCLRRANMKTVGDLVGMSLDDLMRVRNLGRKSLVEIEKKLASMGLQLECAVPNVETRFSVQTIQSMSPDELRVVPIEQLDFSARTYNCLVRSNIRSLGALLRMSREDLMRMRNIGGKSLNEIEEQIASLGLQLAPEFDEVAVAREEIATNKSEIGSRGGLGVLDDLIAAAEGVKMEVPGGEGPGGRGEPGGR